VRKANRDLVEEVVRFSHCRYPNPDSDSSGFESKPDFDSDSKRILESESNTTITEPNSAILPAEGDKNVQVEGENDKQTKKQTQGDEIAHQEQHYYQSSSSQMKFVEFMYYYRNQELLGKDYDASEILTFLEGRKRQKGGSSGRVRLLKRESEEESG